MPGSETSTPVINAMAGHGASGSSQQTTGTIASGSEDKIMLAAGHDFKEGQGIVVRGAGADHGISTPCAPVLTTVGDNDGLAIRAYAIAATSGNGGWTAATPEVSVASNTNLSETDFVQLTFPDPAPAGADTWLVYGRTTGSMHLLAIVNVTSASWQDVGDVEDRDGGPYRTLARRNQQREWYGRMILEPFSNAGALFVAHRILREEADVGQEEQTGSSTPSFNTALGDETVDGAVVWRREDRFIPILPPMEAKPDALKTVIVSMAPDTQLRDSAAATVTDALVCHDDVEAIQNALADAAAAGGPRVMHLPHGEYNLYVGRRGDDPRLQSGVGIKQDWLFTIDEDLVFDMASGAHLRCLAQACAGLVFPIPDPSPPSLALSVFHLSGAVDGRVRNWRIQGGRITWEMDGCALYETSAKHHDNQWLAVSEQFANISQVEYRDIELDGFPRLWAEGFGRSEGGQDVLDHVRIWNYGGASGDLLGFFEGIRMEHSIAMTRRWQSSHALYDSSKTDGRAHPISRLSHCLFDNIVGEVTIRIRSDHFLISNCVFNDCTRVEVQDGAIGVKFENCQFINSSGISLGHDFGQAIGCSFIGASNIVIKGNHCRLSNCSFEGITEDQPLFVSVPGSYCTISDITFKDGRPLRLEGSYNVAHNITGTALTKTHFIEIGGDHNTLCGGVLEHGDTSYAANHGALKITGTNASVSNVDVAVTRESDGIPRNFTNELASGVTARISGCRFSGPVVPNDKCCEISFSDCEFLNPHPERAGRQSVFESGSIDLINCTFDEAPASISAVRVMLDVRIKRARKRCGTATIESGDTSVEVTHGLDGTPGLEDVCVTPTNDLSHATKFWISDASATSFKINVDVDPGAGGADFAWSAELRNNP